MDDATPYSSTSERFFRDDEDCDDARECEVYKYYHPLEKSSSVNQTQRTTPNDDNSVLPPLEEARLKPSHDSALTAFAQLGALRLNARRVIISLLDHRHQYVIAEATKTLSLPKGTTSDEEDYLSFGVGTFARFGTACCEWTAGLTPLARKDTDSSDPAGKVLVVPDLALDDRFNQEPYVCGKPYGRFYAGAPIISPDKHTIGAYCILDDQPRQGLSPAEVDFVKDMAETVMSHLEMVRIKTERRRGQDMIAGLGNFIAGRSSNKNWWRVERRRSRGRSLRKSSLGHSPTNSSPSQHSLSTVPSKSSERDECSPAPQPKSATTKEELAQPDQIKGVMHSSSPPPHVTRPRLIAHNGRKLQEISELTETRGIFERAAKIVCEAVDLDGAIFLDASISRFGGLVKQEQQHRVRNSQAPPTSSTFRTTAIPTEDYFEVVDEKPCLVLGSSLAAPDRAEKPQSLRPEGVPESLLRSLLNRYPKGKIWNYDDYNEQGLPDLHAKRYSRSPQSVDHKGDRWRERKLIQSIFPGVRSLAFIGMWDSNRERWFAGSVIWSCDRTRILSPEIELNYLVAFDQSIMSEIAALDIKLADKAKGTFITSISHELRTPLHGILGSADCLRTTDLDTLQTNFLNTIETCGKTLLETFDNLLSYAKINHMTAMGNENASKTSFDKTGVNFKAGTIGSDHDIMVGALVEEVVSTVLAGQEYLRTGPAPVPEADIGGLVTATTAGVSSKGISSGPTHGLDAINVSISYTDPGDSQWIIRTQPGAWRRLVLNVFGNAIKYTVKGYVNVRLGVIPMLGHEDTRSEVTLVVTDTGQGMSDDFSKDRLFSPFSQENPLSPGTGLGMSIVKQIVDVLGGSIFVKTKSNHGTEVTIVIPVDRGKNLSNTFSTRTISDKCQSVRLKVLHDAIFSHGLDDPVWTFVDIGRKCLGLSINSNSDTEEADIYITSEKHIRSHAGRFSSLLPEKYSGGRRVLVVLSKDFAAVRAFKRMRVAEGVFDYVECIAQPHGPTKVASVLAACLNYLDQDFDRRRSSAGLLAFPDATTTRVKHGDPVPNTSDMTENANRSLAYTRESGHESRFPASTLWTSPFSLALAPSDLSIDTVINARTQATLCATTKSVPESPPCIPEDRISAPTTPMSSNSRDEDDSTSTREMQPEPAQALSAPLPTAAARPSVLLVDDNVVNLRLIATFMQKQKRLYALAENGLLAVKAYRAAVPKVVLDSPQLSNDFPAYEYVFMDIQMPVMDGCEATRQIRAFERELNLRPAKIIALTGNASASAQQESFASGVDLFLVKPVRLKEVVQIMEKT